MKTENKINRLGKMLQERKLIGQTKRTPCSSCGCKIYYIFEDPKIKAI